jgi:hypothetical protein
MKKLTTLLLLSLFCSFTFGQTFPCGDRPCVYLTTGGSSSPVVQLDSTQGKGVGLLAMSGTGPAVWAGAIKEGGVGVWAAGINGATALRVQGRIVKFHEEKHLLKLYDVNTHELIGSFEFSFE